MNGFDAVNIVFNFADVVGNLEFELAVLALFFCVVVAFFAVRLYGAFMALAGALGACFITYSLVGPGGVLEKLVPPFERINSAVAISLAVAALGFIAGVFLPKLLLFLGGIGVGGLLSEIFLPMFAPQSMTDPALTLVFGLSIGVILGVLLSLFSRPVYILVSSVGSLAIGGIIAFVLLFPEADPLRGAAIGAILGLVPILYQAHR